MDRDFRRADGFRRADRMMRAEDEAEMARTETLLREAEESGDYIELNDSVWMTIEQEAFQEAARRRAAK
jgi:hypothetical protein